MRSAAWILLAALASACASQTAPPSVGAIRGVAVDQDGSPLPGITVTLRTMDGKTLQTVTTIEGGAYDFPEVPVGQYQIFSEFAGYTTPQPLTVRVTPAGLAVPPKLVLASPQ